MINEAIDKLNKLVFFLDSRGFSQALKLCLKSINALEKLVKSKTRLHIDVDAQKIYALLDESIESLRRCASVKPSGDPKACRDEARKVYRYALLLYLSASGEVRNIVRARRAAYTSIALGLPTAALFGFPPLATALVFMGVAWTYLYFVRLRLIAWMTLVSSLLVLLPFLVNAVRYFISAIADPNEVATVARSLGIEGSFAILLLILLLAISLVSLALLLYALYQLFRYREVFK